MVPELRPRHILRQLCFALSMAWPIACGDDGTSSSTSSGGTRTSGSTDGGAGETRGIGGAAGGTGTARTSQGGSSSPVATGSAGVAGRIISSICTQAREFTVAKTAALGCEVVGGVDVQCQQLIEGGCEWQFRELFACVRAQPDSNWQCMMELGPVLIDTTPCEQQMGVVNDCVPPA